MIIKLSSSLFFVVVLIFSTFTFIQVPFISLYSPELHEQTIIYQWNNLIIGTYLSNLQILAIVFICLTLPILLALATILLYLVSGLTGLSIFYYGGGLTYIHQDTMGYLFSFIPAAIICGLIMGKPNAEKPRKAKLLIFSGLVCLLTIHALGGLYISFYYQMVPLVYLIEYVIPQIFWQIGLLFVFSVGLARFYQLKSKQPQAQSELGSN